MGGAVLGAASGRGARDAQADRQTMRAMTAALFNALYNKVVAKAAPTIPACERNSPTRSGAVQRNFRMNDSGSSVTPPHRTMRSGHSSACIS